MTKSRTLLRALGLGVAGVVFGTTLTGLAAQAVRAESALTVYTTTASEDLKLYRERFNKIHPDIEIRWVRDSTGIITSKLLSEKDNPQADIVHILASTSMMIMAKEGMFHPYKPRGYDSIDSKFKDRDDPPNWVGNFAYIGTVCFNEVEAEKKNLPKPTSWKDLLDPIYKGQIVMSNPNSSGTGYLNVVDAPSIGAGCRGSGARSCRIGSLGLPRGTNPRSAMHPGPRSGLARDCGTGVMVQDKDTTAGDGPLLRLDRITKRFGDFTALKTISLDVERGEFVVFLGPSGCGKTTLLRVIAGLEPQTGGLIYQDGHEISALPPGRRDYGIVFQSYALFPNLTVFDNVAYGLKSERRGKQHIAEKVAELLDMVGLPGQAGKYPGQLSGGQQQRIAVARAIAVAPGLLLLDEPLSALDARVRVHLRHELKRLQRRLNLTTIMVTHDQAEALTLADRIVVMNHGVIEQIGSPPEIYRKPTTPFVADFVGTMNFFPGVVAGPKGIRLGELDIACAVDGLVEGEAVTVAVRSEDVLLSGAGSAADNQLTVLVEDLDFIGSYYRCVLSAAALGELKLTADFPINFMQGVRVEPGAEVSVTVPEDALHVFSGA